MRRPVEIEFAVTLPPIAIRLVRSSASVRPIVDSKDMLDEDITTIPDEDVLLRSITPLGHGIMNEIHMISYMSDDHYSASNNQNIAWK